MAIQFNIDAGKIAEVRKKRISKGIINATKILRQEIEDNTPTDTGEYKRGHQDISPTFKGNKVEGGVMNRGPYPLKVEYGWKKSDVNWHKGPPRNEATKFYTGTGALVYTRAVDTKKEEIISTLKQSLG